MFDGDVVVFDTTRRTDFGLVAKRFAQRSAFRAGRLVASIPAAFARFAFIRREREDLRPQPLSAAATTWAERVELEDLLAEVDRRYTEPAPNLLPANRTDRERIQALAKVADQFGLTPPPPPPLRPTGESKRYSH